MTQRWLSTRRLHLTQHEREWIEQLQIWLRCVRPCTSCGEFLRLEAFVTYVDICAECVHHRRYRRGVVRFEPRHPRYERTLHDRTA